MGKEPAGQGASGIPALQLQPKQAEQAASLEPPGQDPGPEDKQAVLCRQEGSRQGRRGERRPCEACAGLRRASHPGPGVLSAHWSCSEGCWTGATTLSTPQFSRSRLPPGPLLLGHHHFPSLRDEALPRPHRPSSRPAVQGPLQTSGWSRQHLLPLLSRPSSPPLSHPQAQVCSGSRRGSVFPSERASERAHAAVAAWLGGVPAGLFIAGPSARSPALPARSPATGAFQSVSIFIT